MHLVSLLSDDPQLNRISNLQCPAICARAYDTHIFEPVHDISNNVVCATNKVSDQPAHTRSLISAFASRFSIL